MGRTFRTNISGVVHHNKNGTSRQDILLKCSVGEGLVLKRDRENSFDEHAIAVLRNTGEQIGYIPLHVAFRHPGMNDLSSHMDHGGEVKAIIVGITGAECEIEIEVIGSNRGKPYQLVEASARELRDKAKNIERRDPKEAIRLYRKSLVTMLEVDVLIRKTHHFKKQIAELGYDIGTWRKASLPIERITALLEKEKNYSGCLAEMDNYEKIDDRKGLPQTALRLLRKRKRRVKRILEPKTINNSLIIEQIKSLQADPIMFHEENWTFHTYDFSTGLVDHHRAEIRHIGLGVSSIILEEFDKDILTKKVNEQFKKWDEEWLKYLQQDFAEGIYEKNSI